MPIPPLGMVDDTIGISNCGLDSVLMTAHLNAQTNIRKLQFGEDKCHKLHIGANTNLCCDNFVHTWYLERKGEDISSVIELVDKEGGKHLLETVKSDKPWETRHFKWWIECPQHSGDKEKRICCSEPNQSNAR